MLSFLTKDPRRKDDIILGNLVSTLNWIRPMDSVHHEEWVLYPFRDDDRRR